MIPQLNQEVLLFIAQQVRSPLLVHVNPIQYVERAKSEQTDLANLVQTCKVRFVSPLRCAPNR